MLFQIADTDGSLTLTFEEFRTLIRDRMPGKADDAKISQWYKALDRNGDGVVDAAECARARARRVICIGHTEEQERILVCLPPYPQSN